MIASPRRAARLLAAGCVLLISGTSVARADGPPRPPLPTRVAVLPFQCPRGACQDMAALQAGLVERLVDQGTFEILLTQETEDLFLKVPRFKAGFESLTSRAARGSAPDSATAAMMARRLTVDGYLYGYMTQSGPVVELWELKPAPMVVYHYSAPGNDPVAIMPEVQKASAATTGAIPMTGGAAPTSGGGGSPSRTSGKSSDPGTQLQDNSGPAQALITGSTQLSDRQREIVSSVAEQLHHAREADLKAQGKSFPEK